MPEAEPRPIEIELPWPTAERWSTEPDVPGAVLLVAGEGQLWSFELGTEPQVIGRGPDCDIVIDHEALSPAHAVVRPGPPVSVQDLGSAQGTRIHGAVTRGGTAEALEAGDGFRIGPFTFVLVARARGADASPPEGDLLRIVDPTPHGVPAIVHEVARSGVNVLILGETGVGKEVLAATVHTASGRAGAFTRINCAALSPTLLESELFGHERGAFTGALTAKAGLLEIAQGGTVFLDELGELPLSVQAKLLRAVEQREVMRIGATKPTAIDVRFIAATNRDLPVEVAAGRFRRDLYFRLDGVTFVIPPLRERKRLVMPLALRFLHETGRRWNRDLRFGHEIPRALEQYAWPGNVRELKAVIERAALFARNGEIVPQHLTFARETPLVPPPPRPSPPGASSPAHLSSDERRERERIIGVLEACAGNQTRAAKQLGIARTTLVQKLRLYEIPRPRV